MEKNPLIDMKYVMIEDNGDLEIVRITNVNGSAWTDSNGNKYNEEKVKYIWEKRFPMNNPKYVNVHLLEDEEEISDYEWSTA